MKTKIRTEETSWGRLQHRLFRMVSIGTVSDPLSLGYDIFSSLALIVNLTAAFMMTYDHLAQAYGVGLTLVLEVTTAFFGVDYVLRLLTAECLYPNVGKGRALGKYVISGAGLIDLLSFLPAYLPVMFPGGADSAPLPHQPVLRLPQCHFSGARSETSAASVFFFYHIGADDGLQPVPLQRGA